VKRLNMLRNLSLAVLALSGAVLGGACIDDPAARSDLLCPDRESFSKFVSPLMERRCGMLDCHGNDKRPMRLFGELGLRILDPNDINRTGGDSTTGLELDANYRAVCGVEPEQTNQVALDPGGQSVNKLLLVRKARGQEGHKGGKVFEPFDDADLCVVGWLRGDNSRSIRTSCQRALEKLPDQVELPAAD
jgi:hypothetical protein